MATVDAESKRRRAFSLSEGRKSGPARELPLLDLPAKLRTTWRTECQRRPVSCLGDLDSIVATSVSRLVDPAAPSRSSRHSINTQQAGYRTALVLCAATARNAVFFGIFFL